MSFELRRWPRRSFWHFWHTVLSDYSIAQRDELEVLSSSNSRLSWYHKACSNFLKAILCGSGQQHSNNPSPIVADS